MSERVSRQLLQFRGCEELIQDHTLRPQYLGSILQSDRRGFGLRRNADAATRYWPRRRRRARSRARRWWSGSAQRNVALDSIPAGSRPRGGRRWTRTRRRWRWRVQNNSGCCRFHISLRRKLLPNLFQHAAADGVGSPLHHCLSHRAGQYRFDTLHNLGAAAMVLGVPPDT